MHPTATDLTEALTRLGARRDGRPFRSRNGLLCRVTLDGRPAVLKLTNEPEELTGAQALHRWDGAGAVRVLAADGTATVLERAGRTLRTAVRADPAASRVLCAVAARLHAASPADLTGFPTLRTWFAALFADSTPRFGAARELARDLLDRPARPVLLHGDLHHENILRGDGDRGWLAIDPKGIAGPREFDYCNLFTNPTRRRALAGFDARADLVAAVAGIDRADLLRWVAAWSALSAVWHHEDGDRRAAGFAAAVADRALHRLSASPGR